MTALLFFILVTFLSYFFTCMASSGTRRKMFLLLSFIIFSTALRVVVNNSWNNDYYLYYEFKIFNKPVDFLSYMINEPYLYSVFSYFNYFANDKTEVFSLMYWFNFIITTCFFTWLLTRNDVEMWKKMFLFVFYYFLFGFVLLRNGPVYVLFAMYFYYTFRNKKFGYTFITPFMHISSCLLLITCFHKWRNYYKILLIIMAILIFSFAILKPSLDSMPVFDSILSKISFYSQGMPVIGTMHIVFFILIFSLVIGSFVLYNRKMVHPILVVTATLYLISFLINPIVGHRFSPYVLFALFLLPIETNNFPKKLLIINKVTILLLPVFLYSFFITHKTKELMEVLNNFIN